MYSNNFLLRTDSYKLTHWNQLPPGAETIYSYMEARSHAQHKETVFFGLEYYLQKYLQGKVLSHDMINQAAELSQQHFGKNLFNRYGWEHILLQHEGRLPIRIRAVPEGTVVPIGTPLMTIENTDPKVPWLTNYLESLLMKVWYPITVATVSREVKRTIRHYLEATGDLDLLSFRLHDFGYRGASSEESASIGAAAHLVNFQGTDTLLGVATLLDYYKPGTFPGFSVPASEHSIMTSWGKEHEVDAMRNMLEQYPTGIVSIVSDSYDIFNACENLLGTELRDRILARDGVVVVRPDSGDPCPTILRILNILASKFGYSRNSKGFLLLDSHIRIIQGDGVKPASISRILAAMRYQEWSADNLTFGMGGGLSQEVNRDTEDMAIKCSAIQKNGQWEDVFKTAPGKESKRGRFNSASLQLRFENGRVYNSPTLSEIRERAEVHESVTI